MQIGIFLLMTKESLQSDPLGGRQMRYLIIIFALLMIYRAFKGLPSLSFNIQTLISIMIFTGIGFAIGEHYSSLGWGIFGAVLGGLVAIEVKEKLFKILDMIYADLTEK